MPDVTPETTEATWRAIEAGILPIFARIDAVHAAAAAAGGGGGAVEGAGASPAPRGVGPGAQTLTQIHSTVAHWCGQRRNNGCAILYNKHNEL